MDNSTVILFNLIVPILAGTFFFLYFAYFVLANPSKRPSYRYFIAFLGSFSAFLFGRALQVAAPHPWPLVVVNIRMFILCGIVAPLALRVSDLFGKERKGRKELALVIACVALGATYAVFNTLGTVGSYVLLDSGGLKIHDNLTPSLRPPFYGREVTLAVQALTGLMLLSFSSFRLLRLLKAKPLPAPLRDKNILNNAGIIVFAVSFVTGSLLKQWWIFYASSVLSALSVGAGVLIDVKEARTAYERLVPLIKEEIIHGFALRDAAEGRLASMLGMLGKRPSMDSFAVLRLTGAQRDVEAGISGLEAAASALAARFGRALDEEDFIVLPVSNDRVGVALAQGGGPGDDGLGVVEILEEARADLLRSTGLTSKAGVGRRCSGLEDLHLSYREALLAEEYAESAEGVDVMHAANLKAPSLAAPRYPAREKERLIAAVKIGDASGALASLEAFMERFTPFALDKPEALAVRMYELIGSIIDAAILGGGDERRINDLATGYFQTIPHLKDAEGAGALLLAAVREVAGSVGVAYERRSKALIESAKRCIEERFSEQIGYKDVARRIFISPSHFLNLFKRETGLTFTDYLTSIRIGKAKELLRTTSLSITEIAFQVGYNNSNYFSSIFKKIAGVSAKEYRRGA